MCNRYPPCSYRYKQIDKQTDRQADTRERFRKIDRKADRHQTDRHTFVRRFRTLLRSVVSVCHCCLLSQSFTFVGCLRPVLPSLSSARPFRPLLSPSFTSVSILRPLLLSLQSPSFYSVLIVSVLYFGPFSMSVTFTADFIKRYLQCTLVQWRLSIYL